MKSRSHRLPTSDPPDDWVNGSWTVDCVCGVNYDDGEEMVNCDECGVWVHTRCSCYVKGEKVFSCDKCKTKNSIRNDSEETEVAQLLVELPTKTLRTDNPSYTVTGPPPPRRPCRLWTDIPMEERVHVQGIPGGDPGLFDGSSSIFTPQLWRSTGHAPKKLNFQYKEFLCWDEHQDADKKNEEKRNLVDKGVGALFSLLKENVLPTSVVASSVATKKPRDINSCDKLAFSKDTKDRGSEYLDAINPENGLKDDGTVCQPSVFHSGKRKKEDLGVAKDQSWRKKVKTVNKEADFLKGPVNTLRTVSTLSSDANPLEFYEDRVTKAFKADTEHNKSGNRGNTVPDDLSSDDNCVEEDSICNHKFDLVSAEVASEALPPDVVRNNASNKSSPDKDNAGLQFSSQIHISKKTIDGITSLDDIDSKKGLIKEEVANDALDKLSGRRGCGRSIGIGSNKSETLENKLASATTLAKDNPNFWHSKGDCCLQPNIRVKEDPDIDRSIGLTNIQSTSSSDKKLDDMNASSKDSGLSADQASKNIKVDDTAVFSLQFIDHKVQDLDGGMVVGDQKSDKDDESTTCQQNCQSVGLESIVHQKSSLEGKHGPASADESLRSGGTSASISTSFILRKVACVEKSSPTSSVILNPRNSTSDNHRPLNTKSQNNGTRQKGVNDCNISSKKDNSSTLRDEDGENHNISTTKIVVGDFNMTNLKDNASTDIIMDEGGSEQSKKMRKELPKSSFSLSKASHLSKLSHASAIKRTLSDLKDALVSSSMKTSLTENVPHASNCGQSNLSQSENASCVENKTAASGLPQRGEKTNQSNCQTSSKVNHLQAMLPPTTSNPTAMLSDEELALLLHQELNSSPRVPRVPRIRHAGSLPQLGSPTSAGVLTKRASSSGGRDQSAVSRKKNKDFAKDGSRSSGNLDDESKKSNRGTSLHDQTRHDSACTRDGLSKKDVDNAAAKAALSAKKGMTPAPTATTSSGLSSSMEANEQNLSSTRNSPQNASDEDAGTARHPNHRTLPGLIAEIMSKGKRMAYEELCNAVLPHWPHLRKHNGERYAYTSHSHAVLDCLRNRNEWSQLVDRGPKTSASRKRRKVDADPSSFESGDNDCSRDLTAKEVESQSIDSQRDFPKGKRKARKRRRLALQGRGIKDVRRRRKTDVLIDDMVSFSNSSEESMFSDDEIQGGETCPNGSEASASSNETRGTS